MRNLFLLKETIDQSTKICGFENAEYLKTVLKNVLLSALMIHQFLNYQLNFIYHNNDTYQEFEYGSMNIFRS